MTKLSQAPELIVESWLNTDADLSLEKLRGKVVAVYAFQMLCRGCVEQSIPQARRLHELLAGQQLAVVGLHTVFEHHTAMGRASLAAFVHEYGIGFPVGIDQPAAQGSVPQTMQRYQMQGTPTLLLIDQHGRLRRKSFGHLDDIQLGAEVMSLLRESDAEHSPMESKDSSGTGCRAD